MKTLYILSILFEECSNNVGRKHYLNNILQMSFKY